MDRNSCQIIMPSSMGRVIIVALCANCRPLAVFEKLLMCLDFEVEVLKVEKKN